VQAHSVLCLASQSGRPPKWLRPSSSVSCGFGGAVVSCGATDKIVRFTTVVEQPQLEQASTKFEAEIASTNVIDFCRDEASKATDKSEAQMWGFMQVIFEINARQHLLDHLGFDPNVIAQEAAAYNGEGNSNGVANMSIADKHSPRMPEAAEEIVKKALLVGNFEAAVNCCFETGNLADALVLAQCGGAELWTKTQERYFMREIPKRPFLSVVSAIIHSQVSSRMIFIWHTQCMKVST
jgi:protein transport protein SEC31